jgi:hypothetical protein
MATQTSNYSFNKDDGTDYYDIAKENTNLDLIDATIKTVDDKVVAGKFQTAGGTATALTLTDMPLADGNSKTFIANGNNGGVATSINGKPLYKPGTTEAPKLIAGKAFTVWYNTTGGCFFIKASAEGDAIAENVLAGKTFSNDNDTGLVGTMTNNGPTVAETVNLTTEGAEYTIPKGYHSGLRKIKAVITGLIASVIKAGVTVGGILGTFTSDATAVDADVLSTKTYYRNGVKGTGSIPNKSGAYQSAVVVDGTSTAGRVYLKPPKGYYDESPTAFVVVDDPDFVAANILGTKNIFGLQGNIPDYSNQSVDLSGSVLSAGAEYIQFWPNGYFNGNSPCQIRDTDFIATNILNTANIFGLQGTAVAGKRFASGVTTSWAGAAAFTELPGGTSSFSTLTVTGLAFEPSIIIARWYNSSGQMEYMTTYIKSSGFMYGRAIYLTNIQETDGSGIQGKPMFRGDVAPATVYNGGFVLPVQGYSANYTWYAFE